MRLVEVIEKKLYESGILGKSSKCRNNRSTRWPQEDKFHPSELLVPLGLIRAYLLIG